MNRHLPLLEPMSEIAGRMSAIVGSYHLARHCGGRGSLLGGVPGVAPGRVVVLGGGTAGVNAARVATGIGADVTILEVDFERMRFLDITMGSSTVYSNEANLADLLPRVDLVIGAVLVPGAKAPKLITREMLRFMPQGSVFVDIAVDQGGCAETTRPTTHQDPTFEEEGVLHYCVANMPGAYVAHRDPGSQQRHPSVDPAYCRKGTRRSLSDPQGIVRRHQCHGRETDLPACRHRP